MYRHGHGLEPVWGPTVTHVRATPVLSCPLTVTVCAPRTHRPLTSAPLADTLGSVGSSMVTTDEVVCIVAPGWQPVAPQTTICCRRVVPAGTGTANGVVRTSSPDTAQPVFGRTPSSAAPLGNACTSAPHAQLPRANRPPQRRPVIRVPAGAVKLCAEKFRPAPVA